MTDILSYHDYRQFLRDYFDEKREKNPGFSIASFSKKVGFQSRSFFSMVLGGKRNLSRTLLNSLIQALKITPLEKEYFELLVWYNQASSSKAQNEISEKLEPIAQKIMKSRQVLKKADPAELEALQDYVDWSMFTLLYHFPIKEDPFALAKYSHELLTLKQLD